MWCGGTKVSLLKSYVALNYIQSVWGKAESSRNNLRVKSQPIWLQIKTFGINDSKLSPLTTIENLE